MIAPDSAGAGLPIPDLTAPICTVFGLAVGALIVYGTPRLAAYRLDEPPSLPPAAVLVPLAGGFLGHWRPYWSLVWSAATAAVFLALCLHFGPGAKLVLSCAYSAILIAIATVDIQHRLVLNRLSYPGVVVALAGSFFWQGQGIGSALLGGALGFTIFFVIELLGRGAMGPGDTKLAGLIGAMLGFPSMFNALLAGVLLGGGAGVVYLVVLHRSRKDKFAYGPYLAAGAVLALLFWSPG
jgi:prepilin signal peptidase PulO-like enzyme (type II secretory pathway)